MNPVIIEYPLGDNPPNAKLLYGIDVREALKLLPDQSVQMVATSPPYWGLRNYDDPGQLGLEDTPEEYVANLVDVFREIRRVLRDDGTVWLNLGDSYNSGRDGGHPGGKASGFQQVDDRYQNRSGGKAPGLKPKDLVGIPWRVASALQADGWYLRADIIWAKNIVMPESVRDRPTKAHEYVFLLTKNERYFYDQEAIREPLSEAMKNDKRLGDEELCKKKRTRNRGGRTDGYTSAPGCVLGNASGRNKRSVWNVNPKPYQGAHFAVWPEKLVEPMILAGTSECGACAACGAPWKRIVTKGEADEAHKQACGADKSGEYKGQAIKDYEGTGAENPSDVKRRILDGLRKKTYHWEPTCECEEHPTKRCVVLDPFSGSATTGMVALDHGRNYIGIDINADYLDLAKARLLGRAAPDKTIDDDDTDVMEFFS